MAVVVFGSGQIGQLAVSVLRQCGSNVLGFVDDNPARAGFTMDGCAVLGGRDVLSEFRNHSVCVGVGTIAARRSVADWLSENEYETVNAIHPSVLISPEATIGRNVMIGAGSVTYGPVAIGDGCYIGPSVTVSHDTIVGDYCLLSVGSVIGARVDMSDDVFVGTASTLLATGFGEDERLQVGRGATIGAGSLVIRNVEENTTVMGRPAKSKPAK